MDVALKASLKTGSEAFKWGAITGVVTGGAGKAIQILRKSKTVPTPIASEKAAGSFKASLRKLKRNLTQSTSKFQLIY